MSDATPDAHAPTIPESGSSEPGQTRVLLGIGLAIALHLLQIPIAVLAGLLACAVDDVDGYCGLAAIVPLLLIGVSQLLYIVPTGVFFWRRNDRPLLQGLLIGAALTIALNAACWGLLVGLPGVV